MQKQLPINTTILVFLCSFIVISNAQSLPPAWADGFVYENGPVDPNPIVIEAFFDPVCSDSRDSWAPLKLALTHYGSRVSLLLHLLPLPYHDNAYVASRALHIANMLNSSSTFPLLEQFFKYQDKFYNDQTKNLSKASIEKEVIEIAAVAVGNSLQAQFQAAFSDTRTDLKTRVSFKFSTSRGIYGTPAFIVNGFVLPGVGSPMDYNGWRKIIDPLVAAEKVEGDEFDSKKFGRSVYLYK
ncbi:unnamed protein product [Linum tenue]|uniref:Thioredoxin-like fold domain-containing protein n=1 Tax=Linum tenue TaxID=586396 RepID=A0AAV0LNN5_9ROSI|nr:unnamed protein product [Linum tenue]